jgi:predicted nucleic acid-binding Zn ribbon protein
MSAYKKSPTKIKNMINLLMEKIQRKHIAERESLNKVWKATVSERIGQHTESGSLINGTWVIKVDGPTWMNELTFNKEMITMTAAKGLQKQGIILKELIFRLK